MVASLHPTISIPAFSPNARKLVLRSAPEWIGIPIEEYRVRMCFFYESRKLFDSPSFSNYQPRSSCRQVLSEGRKASAQEPLPIRTGPAMISPPGAQHIDWDDTGCVVGGGGQRSIVCDSEVTAQPDKRCVHSSNLIFRDSSSDWIGHDLSRCARLR